MECVSIERSIRPSGKCPPGGPHSHPCFFPDDRILVWTASGAGMPRPAIARLFYA